MFFWGAVCFSKYMDFELILLFTRVDGLFCLGPRETITTSKVETLCSYQKNNYYYYSGYTTASGSS